MVSCGALQSFFFEYDTPRIVLIRSRKVGLVNRAVQLAILAYVIGWVRSGTGAALRPRPCRAALGAIPQARRGRGEGGRRSSLSLGAPWSGEADLCSSLQGKQGRQQPGPAGL